MYFSSIYKFEKYILEWINMNGENVFVLMEGFFISNDWVIEDLVYGENLIFRVCEIERIWLYRIGRKVEDNILFF